MLRFIAALAFVVLVFVTFASSLVVSVSPPDMPCINWKAWNFDTTTPNINDIFVASTQAWVMQYSCEECSVRGDIIPCWSNDAGHTQTFGHHDFQSSYIPNDYCRIYTNETGFPGVYMAQNFLLPFKGPMYKTHKFVLTQTGAAVPNDVIRVGNRAMALSTAAANGCCSGKGFSGWAEIVADANGNEVFGNVHFSIVNAPFTTQTFQVAVCTAYTNPPATTTPAPPSPTSAPPTTTQTLPPLSSKPFIRFAHTVPTSNKVTATITQGSVSKTWDCFSFGQFSNWEQHFQIGNGQVSINNCTNGAPLIINQTMYLSPGPLIIAIKGYWPLNMFSLEGIAASYVPAAPGYSGVRLFNLMPDVVSAGMEGNGKNLVDGVKFTLGSIWAPITSQESMTFTAFDDQTNKNLATSTFQAPPSPYVFSQFLIGLANASSNSAFAPAMIPLIDAPEQ